MGARERVAGGANRQTRQVSPRPALCDGFEPVVTHIFDSASDYLDSDSVFSVKPTLIRDFVATADGPLSCEHDFVLARRG